VEEVLRDGLCAGTGLGCGARALCVRVRAPTCVAGGEEGGDGAAVKADAPPGAVCIIPGGDALLEVVPDQPGHWHADKFRRQ
jgi:hypothetical protein